MPYKKKITRGSLIDHLHIKAKQNNPKFKSQKMKTTTKQQQNKHAKGAVPLAIYKHITEIKKYFFS